jgi:hypothetical protein
MLRFRSGGCNNRDRNSHRDELGRYQAYKTDEDSPEGV